MGDADDARVWKGGFVNEEKISDSAFIMERVLSPEAVLPLLLAAADVTVPDPISPAEVDCHIRKTQVDKAADQMGSPQASSPCCLPHGC